MSSLLPVCSRASRISPRISAKCRDGCQAWQSGSNVACLIGKVGNRKMRQMEVEGRHGEMFLHNALWKERTARSHGFIISTSRAQRCGGNPCCHLKCFSRVLKTQEHLNLVSTFRHQMVSLCSQCSFLYLTHCIMILKTGTIQIEAQCTSCYQRRSREAWQSTYQQTTWPWLALFHQGFSAKNVLWCARLLKRELH